MEKRYLEGLKNEKLILPKLEIYFSLKLKHTDRYDIFDFYDENNYFELKSRNCLSYQYDDLMMNINKINKGIDYINHNKNVYYVFKFSDGIFYYKQTLNDNFDKRKYLNTMYYFIPTKLLLKINTEI